MKPLSQLSEMSDLPLLAGPLLATVNKPAGVGNPDVGTGTEVGAESRSRLHRTGRLPSSGKLHHIRHPQSTRPCNLVHNLPG